MSTLSVNFVPQPQLETHVARILLVQLLILFVPACDTFKQIETTVTLTRQLRMQEKPHTTPTYTLSKEWMNELCVSLFRELHIWPFNHAHV